MKIYKATTRNVRLSPDVPIKETGFDFTQYGIEVDEEGYGIIADSRYSSRVVVSDTDWLTNIKPNIKEGLKITYLNTGKIVYVSLEQWNSARYINFNNLNSLSPKVYNNVTATHILHEENSGNDRTGSDYTVVSIYRPNVPGTVGVWAYATQKYGLLTQQGNMQIAIK